MDQNESSDRFLHQNCRENWPEWTCVGANVCGLFSTAIWFVVLLPQVWKNFRRKSVRGLSVLWASANFTASLINLFFVFKYVTIPLYGLISSVYSPVLEFTLLIQFWIYGTYRRAEKFAFLAGCSVLWGTVIAVELIFTVGNWVEYAAILLWCIETFPQVILNMKLRSTKGQSTVSVVIAMVGKTADFVSNNGLAMPLQYVIMSYFSTSVAYINGIQVAWYYGRDISNRSCDTESSHRHKSAENDTASGSISESELEKSNGQNQRNAFVNIVRWTLILLISVLLVGCVAGFTLNVHSFYALFAPVSILTVLVIANSYLNCCRKASFNLWHISAPRD